MAAAAAAVVVFSLVQAADKGGGGADSPEEAVSGLMDALAREDVLGALEFFPPEEVRSLPSLYVRAESRARRLDLTGEEGTFSGFDVTVSDVAMSTEPLDDGSVRVVVEQGTVAVKVDPSQASRLLRPSLEKETVRRPLAGMSVVTVEEDGGWYVSWLRTFRRPESAVADLIDRAEEFVDTFTMKDVLRLLKRGLQ